MSSDYKELLDLLEKNKDVPGSEIEHFIKEHKIVESKKTTTNLVIYYVYLIWKLKIGGEPIPRSSFFKQFKRYFKPASRDTVRRYYVQSDSFLLHPVDRYLAKKEAVREKHWYALRRLSEKTKEKRIQVIKSQKSWEKTLQVLKEKRRKRKGT